MRTDYSLDETAGFPHYPLVNQGGDLEFCWDEEKPASNKIKHGISFEIGLTKRAKSLWQ